MEDRAYHARHRPKLALLVSFKIIGYKNLEMWFVLQQGILLPLTLIQVTITHLFGYEKAG